MKIEAEVEHSGAYAFDGGGCAEPCPTAQERSSIGRPEWQPPGCGGCGPSRDSRTSAFDCEHFQFIDDDDEEEEGVSSEDVPATQAPTGQEAAGLTMGESEKRVGLRSVLRKGPRKHDNRVTFDEAVTLYSDDSEDVQTLALTTGPDIAYADVFDTFEPPIEYQDVPPFEPPAEYRDSEEPPAEEEVPPEPEAPISDVAVSKETESTDSATDEVADQSTSIESDQLFERFLEAEREFAVDEELDSVFHALETDFANDDKNGALDDNFFRKLISLLSSAEGEGADHHFSDKQLQADEDDDNSQTHSRTLSEADSDCSISSQDTIIVRIEDESEPTSLLLAKPDAKDAPPDEPRPSALRAEGFDDVFTEVSESASSSDERPRPPLAKNKANGESLSRQSSGEQSVNSGHSQDPPQDADDSTSSDSRSGEVEEEIRLDDIGYDEEDAEDYDEESFRGMAHGNSKIRRIIKKNALQCTLFRGIEAKRRQQPGAKYPRPKSPLLSQESLVEKLKWLTTIDEQHKDADASQKFLPKPPDVILSTGGSIPHSASSEDDIGLQGFQPPFYQVQPRHILPPGYYVRRDFPPSLPRQRVAACQAPMPPYPAQNRVMPHHAPVQQQQQQQWPDQQQQRPLAASMTVPRNFRDWRIIQRITGNRGGSRAPQVAADYVRCPNGGAYPDRPDELEQFVEKDSKRMDMIRKRYSVAEEEEDPTFGFARRPSVRGVQNRVQPPPPPNPSENNADQHSRSRAAAAAAWGWRGPEPVQPSYVGRSQVPMHIHRASVALTELPGSATLPYAHRKPHPDTRYHSYAESMYGSTRTLPTKGWLPPPPMLQVPPHSKDERGVPEGASSSPKISSDSLYHAPVPDAITTGGPHKEDGIIYYSLNV